MYYERRRGHAAREVFSAIVDKTHSSPISAGPVSRCRQSLLRPATQSTWILFWPPGYDGVAPHRFAHGNPPRPARGKRDRIGRACRDSCDSALWVM